MIKLAPSLYRSSILQSQQAKRRIRVKSSFVCPNTKTIWKQYVEWNSANHLWYKLKINAFLLRRKKLTGIKPMKSAKICTLISLNQGNCKIKFFYLQMSQEDPNTHCWFIMNIYLSQWSVLTISIFILPTLVGLK